MTYEEAMKDIQYVAEFVDKISLDTAIEALQKQIPEKPYKHKYCPKCKETVLFRSGRHIYGVDLYCHTCGQRIKWE